MTSFKELSFNRELNPFMVISAPYIGIWGKEKIVLSDGKNIKAANIGNL